MICTKSTAVVIETSEIRFHELRLDSFQGAWFPFNVGLLISSAIHSSFVWNNSANVALFELFCKWQEFSWKRSFTTEKWTYPWEDDFYSGRSIYSQPACQLPWREDVKKHGLSLFQSYCKAIRGFPSIQQKHLSLTSVLTGYISIWNWWSHIFILAVRSSWVNSHIFQGWFWVNFESQWMFLGGLVWYCTDILSTAIYMEIWNAGGIVM